MTGRSSGVQPLVVLIHELLQIESVFAGQVNDKTHVCALGAGARKDVQPVQDHTRVGYQFQPRPLLSIGVRPIKRFRGTGKALGLNDLFILNSLWQERTVDTSEDARLIQNPEAEARATLHRLVEAGIV